MTLYVLKRSNGCYGIYKDGKSQENLISNSFLTDSANLLINRLLVEVGENDEQPQIIFTDSESYFQNDLPELRNLTRGGLDYAE